MSSTVVRDSSWSTSMRAVAKCTVTDSTPVSRPTCFSIFFTHEGQEKPSARSSVWVVVGVAMIVPLVCVSDRLALFVRDVLKVPSDSRSLLDGRQVEGTPGGPTRTHR